MGKHVCVGKKLKYCIKNRTNVVYAYIYIYVQLQYLANSVRVFDILILARVQCAAVFLIKFFFSFRKHIWAIHELFDTRVSSLLLNNRKQYLYYI